MASYKNEKQFTTLIHAGDNVTITPPGFINAEGGGVSPDDIKAPFYFYNKENEAIGYLSEDGDLRVDGTVYINAESGAEGTDIRELSPIFDIDIVGDYTNGTFTSSQTFADITEAMETGHTLIARDSNGFVYTQAASEFDPETTDIITFSSVQPDGLYYLYWTGSDRTIGFRSISDSNIVEISTTGKTQADIWTEANAAITAGKTPLLIYQNEPFKLSKRTLTAFTFNNLGIYDYSTDINYHVNEIVVSKVITSSVSLTRRLIMCYKNATQENNLQFYFREDGFIWSHPTSAIDSYKVGGTVINGALRYYANATFTPASPNRHLNIIYVENGNHHVCWLSDIPENDGGSETYPKTYKFRSVEPYSSNTIIIYEIVVTITGSNAYTVTGTTNTYTIGS